MPTGEFWALVRRNDELSLLAPEASVPEGVLYESGWRALIVRGPLELGLVGVLLRLLEPLAAAGVPILALSTFDTDVVAVPDDRLAEALAALRGAGIGVHGEG